MMVVVYVYVRTLSKYFVPKSSLAKVILDQNKYLEIDINFTDGENFFKKSGKKFFFVEIVIVNIVAFHRPKRKDASKCVDAIKAMKSSGTAIVLVLNHLKPRL